MSKQRELKFRAWITHWGEDPFMLCLKPSVMRYDYEHGFVLAFSHEGYPDFGAHERYPVKPEDMTIMQFTGLHDKNGKEIYEGDVVALAIPEVKSATIRMEWDDQHAAFMMIGWEQWPCYAMQWSRSEPHSEIIGNIHENPELLST